MEVTVVALLGDAEQAAPALTGEALMLLAGYLGVHRALVSFECECRI
jgi:hypothetical protein